MHRAAPELPRVPPPAPADHPWRDAIVIVLFAVGVALPLVGAVLKRDMALTTFEKRPTAPWPSSSSMAGDKAGWAKRFEAAFADRFGGRDLLIAAHHFLLAAGLHVSPVAKVLMGRDGWLYFRGEDEQAIDRDYRGLVPYPPEQPAQIARELKHRRDLLHERGIPYFVLVVPDKATMYPEHLPQWVKRAPVTRLDRLFAALSAYPDLEAIDARALLAHAKSRGVQVYYRTDSHWNYGGATAVYDGLIERIRRAVPNATHAPAEDARYEPGDKYSGDLAQLLGLPRWFEEDDWFPFRKILGDSSRRCAGPVPAGSGTIVLGCARAGLPRALVYRDSMFDAMIPPLSENFSRVVYFPGHRLTMADIAREQPSVVIEEFVERTMHALLVDPAQ